jgi:hypothetical protein
MLENKRNTAICLNFSWAFSLPEIQNKRSTESQSISKRATRPDAPGGEKVLSHAGRQEESATSPQFLDHPRP